LNRPSAFLLSFPKSMMPPGSFVAVRRTYPVRDRPWD
jgi:hypothetical protein